MMDTFIYTPCEMNDPSFFDGVEDKRQRRALALVGTFGTPGGGDKVCFVGDKIIIASPPEPHAGNDDVGLTVKPLDEFIADFSNDVKRNAEPATLAWIETLVNS